MAPMKMVYLLFSVTAEKRNSGGNYASEHIGEGDCFDDPVEIRVKNNTEHKQIPVNLVNFCCKICEKVGCTPCGKHENVSCPATASPVYITMYEEINCYVNCVCKDLDEGHNHWVTILSYCTSIQNQGSLFGSMMIFIKFLTYFVYKSKKIYNAYHIRKDKINESIKDGIENPGDTRRYSWFLGTTLRREENLEERKLLQSLQESKKSGTNITLGSIKE